MSVTEQLKRIYNELPRPHHLVICAARYEEVVRGLPAPPTPDFHQPSLLDLQIYVGEIPRDEIHSSTGWATSTKWKGLHDCCSAAAARRAGWLLRKLGARS